MNYNNQPPQQPWQPGQPQPNQWPPQQPLYTQPYASHPSWQSTPPGQPWPPQPPKRKPRIWVYIVGGIVALVLCSIAGHATQSTTQASTTTTQSQATQAPTPTPTTDPSQNPAFQMAGIDGNTTTPDSVTVAKYQRVLDDLHRKTSDSELDIANETVAGQQILAKRGQSISLYDLASAVDKGIPPGSPKRPYAESLAAITTLMSSPNQ